MKKYLSVLLVLAMMAALLTSCGKKEEADTKEEPSTEVAVVDEPVADGMEVASTEETEEVKEDVNDSGNDAFAKESKEAYEKFLKGEEKLHFDNIRVLEDKSVEGLENGIFYESEPLSIEDFNKAYCEGMNMVWEDNDYETTDILYSYIDCGDDGIPELALKFTGGQLFGSEYTDIFVIKYIDTELQLCFQSNAGYRAYNDINKYGFVTYGGSNSAFSHGADYSIIDASGNLRFVYREDDTYSISGIYIPDQDFDAYQVALNLGIEDDLYVVTYDILDRDEDFYSGNYDYGERIKNYIYTYTRLDANGEEIEDDSIYNSDSPYRQLWDSTGLPFYTEEEARERLWERRAACGVTDKIAEEEWIEDWTSIYK